MSIESFNAALMQFRGQPLTTEVGRAVAAKAKELLGPTATVMLQPHSVSVNVGNEMFDIPFEWGAPDGPAT